jgi:hypothetical protein
MSIGKDWHLACFKSKVGPAVKGEPDRALVAGMAVITSTRVVSVFLLTACSALCQRADTYVAPSRLPEAPSIESPSKTEVLRTFQSVIRTPAAAPLPVSDLSVEPLKFGDVRFTGRTPQNPADIFDKYLSPAAVRRSHVYHPLTEGALLNRATYAASSILIMRDPTGKKKLNTSYLLSVLAATASHTAGSPYWKRSVSQPFGDVGSTIGNDAGMNLFHEFEPGIRSLVQSHTPRFVTRIENRILK